MKLRTPCTPFPNAPAAPPRVFPLEEVRIIDVGLDVGGDGEGDDEREEEVDDDVLSRLRVEETRTRLLRVAGSAGEGASCSLSFERGVGVDLFGSATVLRISWTGLTGAGAAATGAVVAVAAVVPSTLR